MSGLKNYLRIGSLLLGSLASFVSDVDAQGTAWSPSRSASRPNAGTAYSAEPSVPDWQRSPVSSNQRYSAPASRSTSSRFAPQYSSAPTAMRTSYDDPGYGNRSSKQYVPSQRGSTQRMNYDVQLGPGEKLVGQPTYSEEYGPGQTPPPSNTGTSRRPTRFASDESKPEFVPTPDGVSSDPMPPIVRGTPQPGSAHGHEEGEVHLEPGFNYEDGEFGNDGEMMYDEHGSCADGNCDSCVGGDCDSCTGGFGAGLRDEWADPTCCPKCGGYGYHRPGCGRVAMCLHNCLGPLIREWSVFAGVQGFKGPLDGGNNGNFGFNEGFNLAGPLFPWPRMGLGYQIGGRFAQSNLSGSPFNTSARDQAFATVGLFHRAYRNCGFQWGFVYDWMTDNYTQTETYGQMRTELSWLFPRGHEFGFLGMFGVKSTNNNQFVPVTQADMYNLFYRHTTNWGGQGRAWVGMTNHSLAIVGSDFRVPLSNRFEMVGGFNYIIPNDGNANGVGGGFTQESWGISMNLVWYVGRPKQGVHNTPFRPLFNVADNNVMMFERQ